MSGQNFTSCLILRLKEIEVVYNTFKKKDISHICIVALVRRVVWFSLEPSGVFGSTNPVVYTNSSVL